MDVISVNGNVFVFDTYFKRLSQIQLFPRKVETVVQFDQITFDSVTAYEGKFYLSSGTTIYELTTDGKLTTFIDGKDLTYNDGNTIRKIGSVPSSGGNSTIEI